MAGKKTGQRNNARANAVPIVGLLLGGVGLVILMVSVGIFFLLKMRQPAGLPAAPLVENPAPPPIIPQPAPVMPTPAPAVDETWWPKDSNLHLTVYQLQGAFPQEKDLFKSLGTKTAIMRWEAYKNLIAKLPDLLNNESAKRQLARLLSECYALEPEDGNLTPLRNWLVDQIPRAEKEYPPGFKMADLDRSFWALEVGLDALTHKAIRFERGRNLAQDLGRTFGFALDPSMPRAELKETAEKLLSLRCYGNLAPTAAKSLEDALALRGPLLVKTAAYLSPSFREKVDLELAYIGLPRAKSAWPAYSALLTDCLKSDDVTNNLGIVQLYEQADADLAAKMDTVLASKWKAVGDAKLDQLAKVKAIRRALGVPDPTDRLTLLEKLSRETLAGVKAPAHQSLAILQETARLTHASTMACALMQKEIGLGRFDYLIANVPEFTIPEAKAPDAKGVVAKKAGDNPKPPMAEPMPPNAKGGAPGNVEPRVYSGQLTAGALFKIHPYLMRRGTSYEINMTSDFDSFLRLQNSQGAQVAQDDDGGGGLNARIVFSPPYDDTYRIVATTGKRVGGPYTVSIQESPGFGGPGFGGPGFGGPGFGGPGFPFGPRGFVRRQMFMAKFGMGPMFPPPAQQQQPPVAVVPGKKPAAKPDKAKTPATPASDSLVDDADLNNLLTNVAKTRVTALQNIAAKFKGDLLDKDLTTRQAARVAKYLVAISDYSEVEQVLPSVPPLGKSRNLLLALADNVEFDKAIQKTNEAVIGTLLDQTLQFGRGDAWRLHCRRLLIQRALERTGEKRSIVTDAADLLRDYYKEQASLLGVPADDLTAMTKPSHVLAAMINHTAAKLVKNGPAKADKEQLDLFPRCVLAAQFAAQDDLELTAMLQRVWLKTLAMRLAQTTPERSMEMRRLSTDLSESDPLAVNVLEQLRAGEEKVLRLWGLGLDLK